LIEIDKNASKKTVDETETSEEEKRQKELDRFNSLGGQLVKSNQAAQKNIVKPEMAAAPTQDMQNDELVVKDEHEMQVAEMKSLEKELTLRSESDLSSVLKEEVSSEDQLKKIIDSATIPVIVAAMINFALHKRASDIHIEPTEKEVRLRFRIDGILYDIMSMPRYFRSALISRVKIMSKLKIDEQRVPQDGRFDVVFSKQKIDVRVSTLPTIFGEKVAMRLLDKSAGLYTLEELGLSGSNLKRLEENILKPYGIILATGPTGSGKSTTLYAILKRISNPSVNIITLEDPVEYEIPGVNQCLVKPKIGFSFAEGLRSVLRQDPNIIMVGEIRDSETANLGVQAAMTGHLVLSSLHTNNASGAIPRLVNMKVEPFLITSTVSAIIAQRLVRRICQHCKQEVKLHQEVEMKVRSALENLQGTDSLPANLEYKFYQGKGCSECHLGYAGRIGLYEIMVMSDELEKLTVQNRPTS
jgi:type II secretory ATPase GspE/PulE/Tfp pilus assembly ATPase PilB-like protein